MFQTGQTKKILVFETEEHVELLTLLTDHNTILYASKSTRTELKVYISTGQV